MNSMDDDDWDKGEWSWPKAIAYAAKWLSIAIILCAFAYCASTGH